MKSFLRTTNTSIDADSLQNGLKKKKEKGLKLIRRALGDLLSELQKNKRVGAYRPDYAFSAFLTYWTLGALWEWREDLQDNDSDSDGFSYCSDGDATQLSKIALVDEQKKKNFPTKQNIDEIFYDIYDAVASSV